MKTLTVFLADDHALVRAGIRSLLEGMHDIEVVGEASDGASALAALQTLEPDLLLIDISMPGISGLEVTARALKIFPRLKVIVLSMHAEEAYVVEALQAGAAGYLIKASTAVELDLAIEAVRRDERYLSPAVSRAVIDGCLARVVVAGESHRSILTPRQTEILRHVVDGETTKEIALKLNVSVKTVETHRAQLMERLGIHNVPGLVRYAMRSGLIASPVEGAEAASPHGSF
jgi:DNA-binding NarL/FixJ family response regulator